MPELPEVEVLRRHLLPAIKGRKITAVHLNRQRVIRPTTPAGLKRALMGARIVDLARRGKFLLFQLRKDRRDRRVLGHLGMTGRMFVQPQKEPLPKHTAVHLELGAKRFVYEDTRYFGRFTLDVSTVDNLGPEPLSEDFTADGFRTSLGRSAQAIKVKLLDQALVAGVGNIYASEALFRAGISPRKAARRLTRKESDRLYGKVKEVLADAIDCGSTMPLDFSGTGKRDGLFYYGLPDGAEDYYEERLLMYDREGEPCPKCRTTIRRIVQAARSTFFCPRCQR